MFVCRFVQSVCGWFSYCVLLCLLRCFGVRCLGCECSCCCYQRGFVFYGVDWRGVVCSSVVDVLGVVLFVCIVRRVV